MLPPVRVSLTALPLCVAMATLPGLCPSAHAEHPPTIALVVSGPVREAGALQQRLVQENRLPVVLVSAALPNQGATAPDPTPVADALEALAQARAAYVGAEFERCLRTLDGPARAVALLAQAERGLAARVLLWSLACQVGRGAEGEANHEAEAFAALELAVPDDVGQVAQDAEAVLTRALRAAGRSARATLRMDTSPGARHVEVDGRVAGCETPCTLALLPGEHVLRLWGDGTEPVFVRAALTPQGSTLRHTLPPATPELARSQWSAHYGSSEGLESAGSLSLLAQALAADKLLVLTLLPHEDARIALRGSYLRAGALAARDATEAGSANSLQERGERLLSSLLVRGKTITVARPVWKSPWFWSALGLAAAGAAVGTAYAVRPGPERTEVRFQ
ncbi:MAG: hypothetical protein RL385_326 [Pseudomonadota bacterium]|jgi:hypothetical protein